MRRLPIDAWSTGMNKDLAVAKLSLASNTKANTGVFYENRNIRFSFSDKEGTLTAITNEQGNTLKINTEGQMLGYAVIDNILVSFEKGEDKDYIVKYIWKDEDNEFEEVILAQGDFKFNNKIETVVSTDNDLSKKVFWIDGENPMRVINFLKKYGETYTEKFDVLPLINSFPECDIKKIPMALGGFKSGTIQWCYTYLNDLDCESNILDVTPIYYLSDGEKGSEKNANVHCSFEITFSNLDENFNRIVLYSIQRTSLDTAAYCKRVGIYSINGRSITIIDGGTIGEIIDSNDLYFKNRELVIPKTFCVKDNTLFFGNYKKSSDEKIKYTAKEVPNGTKRSYNLDHLGVSENLLDKNSYEIAAFNPKEQYRLGYQLQDNRGYWRDPVYFKDSTDEDFSISISEDCFSFNSPKIKLTLEDSTNIKRARSVVYYPQGSERKVITTGVFFPTIFNIHDRNSGNCWAYSSWYSRPQVDYNIETNTSLLCARSSGLHYANAGTKYPGILALPKYKNGKERFHGSKHLPSYDDSNLPYKQDESVMSHGSWVEFRHYKALPNLYYHNCEIMGHIADYDEEWPIISNNFNELSTSDSFFVDRSFCSFYSPDIQNYSHGEKLEGDISISYKAPLLNSIPSINMVTEVSNFNNQGVGSPGLYDYLKPVFNNKDYGWKTVVSGGFWIDYSSHLNMDDNPIVFNISPWHVNGYLNNGGELDNEKPNSTYSFKRWCSYRIAPYLEKINDIKLTNKGAYAIHSDSFILPKTKDRSQLIYKKNYEKILYSPGDVALGGMTLSFDVGLTMSTERIKLNSHYMIPEELTQDLVINKGWKSLYDSHSIIKASDINSSNVTVTSIVNTFNSNSSVGYFFAKGDDLTYDVYVEVYAVLGKARFDKDGIGNGYYNRNAFTIIYVPYRVKYKENRVYEVFSTDTANYSIVDNLSLSDITYRGISLSNEGRTMYYFDYMAESYSGVFNSKISFSGSDPIEISFSVLGGDDDETNYDTFSNKQVIGGRPYSFLGVLTSNYRKKYAISVFDKSVKLDDVNLSIPYRDWVISCSSRPLWDYAKNSYLDEVVYGKTSTINDDLDSWYKKEDGKWQKVSLVLQEKKNRSPKMSASNKIKTYSVNDTVTIKSKSAPHFVIDLGNYILPIHSDNYKIGTDESGSISGEGFYLKNFNEDSNISIKDPSSYGYLLVGDIINNSSTDFVSIDNEFYKNQPWYVAGRSVEFNEKSIANIPIEQGDHFFTTHLILKSYPYGDNEKQGITDIVEVPLLSRINGAGRYDNNIGNYKAYWAKESTYGLINDSYSQTNNFFQFFANTDKELEYENYISWTLPKTSDYIIDSWTYQTLEANKILNGVYGKLTKLVSVNNAIYAFQDSAISSINYNLQSIVQTQAGVPLEVANSSSVADPVRFIEQVGCQDKFKIATTAKNVFFVDDYGKSINMLEGNQVVDLSQKLGFYSWTQSNSIVSTLWDRKNAEVWFRTQEEVLVFNESLAQFTSFYDYKDAEFFINIQNSGFTVKGNELWHQQSSDDWQTIYGELTPAYIDFVVGEPTHRDKIFDIVEFNGICSEKDPYRDDYYYINEELNEIKDTPNCPIEFIQAYNEYQDSKEVYVDVKRKFRVWRCLVPRDAINYKQGRIKNRIRNPWTHIRLYMTEDNLHKKLQNLKVWYTE